MKNLSILICSLKDRKFYLERLLDKLNPQLNDNVEVIVESDNGEMTIGEKRNTLVEKSSGEYICFIDDDDLVSDDYVELILSSIQNKPDVVGFKLDYFVDGVLTGVAEHTIKNNEWKTLNSNSSPYRYLFLRNPNHLNPIKREIALKIPYQKINHGEDRIFSSQVYELLKSENYIDKAIYYYYFRTKK